MKKEFIKNGVLSLPLSPFSWMNILQQRIFSGMDKRIEKPRKRKKLECIGRISLPVNPSAPKQSYLPCRMSNQQIEQLNPSIGKIVFNTCQQTYQRYTGKNWQTITHYPGERLLGGIVTYIDNSGDHGLLTSISHQITAVQWTNSFNRTPVSVAEVKETYPMQRFQLSILKGSNTSYAARMARHYCVRASGETIRGWRIPSLAELVSILQDPILGASFKCGSAWGFSDKDTIYWLHIQENNQPTEVNPENYFIRLVREF